MVPLAQALPDSYALIEVLLSSAYSGWGTSSLDVDVKEIAQCVAYFRKERPQGNIVLFGHSTGCQDVIHYLITGISRPGIDGGILQGAVSDREALVMLIPPKEYEQSIKIAREYLEDGREGDCLPSNVTGTIFPGPVSASRWLSLASPAPDHAGQDDYFSSDFDDERLKNSFGKAGSTGTPLCILCGDSDPFVPTHVDKERLMESWIKHIKEGGGVADEGCGLIKGGTHTFKEKGQPLEDLIKRILSFLSRLPDR